MSAECHFCKIVAEAATQVPLMSFVKGLMPKMMAVRMYPSFWIPSKAITFINSAMNPFKVKNDSEGIHE